MKHRLYSSLVTLLSLVSLFVFADLFGAAAAPPVQPEVVDISNGQMLYDEHCAACHGENLEGQENWRSPGEDDILPAPPHDETGHTWHHGDALIFNYTKLGGKAALADQGLEFKSGMPGFGESLSDQEIWDILGFIKGTWSKRIQELQAVRTKAEQLRGDR